MRKTVFSIISLLGFAVLQAQNDSIYIHAVVESDLKTIHVTQRFNYKNLMSHEISEIKLLNWIAAYQNDNTPLSRRKLEDRKRELYFAKQASLGKLNNIEINSNPYQGNLTDENLFVPLHEPLQSGEEKEIRLQYTIQLPQDIYTGYGYQDMKALLKYFFIVPDGFEAINHFNKYYVDIEETQSGGKKWKVDFTLPEAYQVQSNLAKINSNSFSGYLTTDPEFYISLITNEELNFNVEGQNINLQFGYPLTHDEKSYLEFYLPLQLQFLKKKIGNLPDKLFFSQKFKNKNDFFGNDDIKFWKFKFQMFNDAEKIDMDYFSMVSTAVVDNLLITNKTEDHWIKNGIKTYLETSYIQSFYADKKLIGNLADTIAPLGLKPLKIFHASKLDLLERYGIMYQYMSSQNLDQKIGNKFTKLSNFNEMAISQFKTGSLLSFIAEKMSQEKFDQFLQGYFQQNQHQIASAEDFLNGLSKASNGDSEFLNSVINQRQRINLKLKSFKKDDQHFQLKIQKNTDLAIPFKVTAMNNENSESYWFNTTKNKRTEIFTIPNHEVKKILVNDQYIFPESNYRDNYIYTKGLFSNTKKIKFKLFEDIPNPEFNEIYLNPRLNFNAYDKVLLGLNFRNKSLFDQNFIYSVTPFYSTGTNTFTGSGAVAYSFRPLDAFYRSWQVGISGSKFHYNYDLGYRRVSIFSGINFTKDPRSTINRNLNLSYNFYEKDLTPAMIARNDYDKYHLFSIGYGYAENKLIHEIAIGGNLQAMKDFQKVSGEGLYRWEYAPQKKISFRAFGGYFFNNKTRNNLFDFGTSKLSNYSFSYGLLGQSATDGILSQQFILAEGGFKSEVAGSVNQWILSTNVDGHLWKWFNLYADAGVYKNKGNDPKFIWDSGVKVKVIPDFLEIYFPIQSSLGFEPSFKDYGTRIRYTLIFDLNSLTNYFRRGWF